MLTIDELTELIHKDFDSDDYPVVEWYKKKDRLIPHPEGIPIWETDEDGTEYVADYEQEMCEGFATYDDELAGWLWSKGCNVSYTQDYWDGSPTYYIGLPKTEEEYQKNLEDYRKNNGEE